MKAYNSAGALLQTGGGGGGGGGGTFSGGFSTMGNTAGDTGVKTDRLVLVGSNNITLSGSTNAGSITVSIIGGAGAGGAAISAAGNSISAGTAVWSNSNNVSFGMAGSTITATASFSQSNQSEGVYALGNTTGQSSSSTYDARTLSINGAGIVSVGWSNSSLYVSATQSNQAFSADASSTFQTLTFQNSNGVSFSNNAGALRVTHDLQFTSNTSNIPRLTLSDTATSLTVTRLAFTQSNGLTMTLSTGAGGATVIGSYTVPTVTNSSMTVSDAATSGTLARLAFTNLNGITLSLSTGAGGSHTIVGSHNALTSQSNQAFSAAGGSSAFQTLSFSDNAQASFTNNAGQVAITNVRLSASATGNTTLSSTQTYNLSSVIFRGSNQVSIGLSNGSIIVDATTAAQTNQQMTFFATGNTTQSSTGTINASSIILRGSNIVSVGVSNGSLIFDATQSNQAFSAAGGSSAFQTLSFSDNAQASWTNNAGQVALTNVRATFSATGNTTLSSTQTFNLSSMVIAGSGIASVGVSNGSIVVSVPAGGGAGDGGNVVMVSTGGHTAGNTGSTSTGTFVFEGTSSLTLSQITGGAGVHTIRLIPAMSQLTAGDNISLSTAGSTITIINLGAGTGVTTGTTAGTAQAATLSTNGLSILEPVYIGSNFQPEYMGVTVAQSMAMGTGYFQPFILYDNLSMYRINMLWQNTTQLTLTQSFSGSVSGGTGSTGATGRVGSTGTVWLMSRESTGTNANSSNLKSFYSNSMSMQFDALGTVSNSTNASSATVRWTTDFRLTFVSSIGSDSYTTGSTSTNSSGSFSSTSTNGQTFSSNAGTMSFASSILSGVRNLIIPMFTSLTPGEYWLVQNWSSSSASTNYSLQRLLLFSSSQMCFTTNTSGFLRIGATQTTANSNLTQAWGSHSATSKFTNTFGASEVSNMSQYKTWFNMQALVS